MHNSMKQIINRSEAAGTENQESLLLVYFETMVNQLSEKLVKVDAANQNLTTVILQTKLNG